MGDREPRRRKKRRDLQKKEEVRSDDHIFASTKSESRDSDQETEDEIVIPSHQSNNVSKIVFIILFSGLVVSLSFIFISLQGSDKGPVDIFDASHDDHHDAHGEALHDEHIEEALHDDHDDHEEDEVKLEDLIPGLSSLGSIFSLNNELIEDIEGRTMQVIPEDVHEEETEDTRSTTIEPEITTDQGILEEYSEEMNPILEETLSYTEATPITSYTEDESSYSTLDYSEPDDYTTSSSQSHTAEPMNDEPEDTPTTPYTGVFDENEQDSIEDSFSFYERSDITNEDDFEIRDQLDDIDSGLERESNNEDEDDYDEDDEEDDGAQDEFDFWQF